MKLKPMIALTAALLAGCGGLNLTGPNYYVPPPRAATGSDYQPLIDNAGPNHDVDLIECQQYAASEASPASGAVAGAAGGALVGVALDAISGTGSSAAFAGIGALTGGVQQMAGNAANQKQVIANCMRGRGYNVLR